MMHFGGHMTSFCWSAQPSQSVFVESDKTWENSLVWDNTPWRVGTPLKYWLPPFREDVSSCLWLIVSEVAWDTHVAIVRKHTWFYGLWGATRRRRDGIPGGAGTKRHHCPCRGTRPCNVTKIENIPVQFQTTIKFWDHKLHQVLYGSYLSCANQYWSHPVYMKTAAPSGILPCFLSWFVTSSIVIM